jgi:hypothetical protein
MPRDRIIAGRDMTHADLGPRPDGSKERSLRSLQLLDRVVDIDAGSPLIDQAVSLDRHHPRGLCDLRGALPRRRAFIHPL